MSIEVTTPSPAGAAGIPPLAGFRTDMEIMSAEDILAYVALALGNIGKQLDSYKAYVQEKQAAAADLNKALTMARTASRTGDDHTKFTQEQYTEFMLLLAKYPEDPGLQAAHKELLASWGGYIKPDGGDVGKLAMADLRVSGVNENLPGKADEQNGHLNPTEWKNVIDHITSSLEALNSDNEYTMMKLQTLMQQRNQISQFASNMLNSLHENAKAIIGNLRA
jgi:hypothetical protein